MGLQLHRENFSAGLSYDFPFLTVNPGNSGALEIGLTLRKLVVPKIRRIAKRKLEEKKKALAKTPSAKKTETKINSKPDSVLAEPSSIPEVEIVKTDTVRTQTKASAGKISQEPIIVEKIMLHFHFEYNSVDLDEETEDFLTGLSTTLTEDKSLKLKITGHTDNIGPEKFNQKLSVKRAEAIRSFLLKKGIERERLEALGRGMKEPLNTNESEDDRAKNRRVEILLYHDN
jgi:outer membrane protein OmpA-like peptidoglycan-associated protein